MASFQNMVITSAGLELLQDLILEGGTPLTFSGVGVGDGLLEDSDITARTSLVHEVHRLPIEKIEKQEGGHIRVFARLATDIITTDFYHRELGVFTRHGEQEILFAYGNAGDDYDFIPATGNNASICKTIVTEFTVGSMKAVFLPLDSTDMVTHAALNAALAEIPTQEQLDARYGQLAAANTWTQPQTYEGLVIKQPNDTFAVVYADDRGRTAYSWLLDTNGDLRLIANFATATAITIDNDWGAVSIDYLNVANASMTGPAVFDAGVTIGQTLWCNGVGTFTAGIGVGENITLYAPGNGVQAAVIQGIKKVENGVTTSGISLSSHGGVKFLEIVKDDQNKFVEIRKVGDDLSFNIYGVNNLNADNITTKKITFGPNDIFFYDNEPNVIECTATWRPYGLDVRGPSVFSGGVTMGQTLNVSGVATMFRCAVYSADYSLFSVLTGAAVWQNRTSGVFDLRGDDAYGMGVLLNVGRSNGEPARIIKQNQKEDPSPTDVPNLAEGDDRWVKFNNTLTAAQYAALEVKDQTTLYITSDTGKIYLGSYSLN